MTADPAIMLTQAEQSELLAIADRLIETYDPIFIDHDGHAVNMIALANLMGRIAEAHPELIDMVSA